MRMRKRLMGLMLALVFVVGSLPMAVPAQAAAEDNTEAANLAIALGYMDTDASGAFNGDKIVTRGEYAGYVMRFLGLSDIEMQQSRSFLDIEADTPHYKDIMTAYAMGMFQPIYTDFFSPDSGIRAADAVRAILVGLGYQPAAEQMGGSMAYLNLANRSQLLVGVDTSGELTRNAVAKLFYNGLRVGQMRVTGTGRYEASEETLLDAMDIRRGVGRITGNEYSYLVNGDQHTAKGKVLIDDEILLDVGDTNAADYLGYTVIYYYNETSVTNPYLVMVMPKAENLLTIDAQDIISYDKAEGRLTYEAGGKSRKASVSVVADMIYNGRALPGFTEAHMAPQTGSITLYASQNGSYDTIIVNSYINYVADSVNETQMVLYDKYGKAQIELDNKNECSYEIRSASGAELALGDIKAGNVVSVRADKEIVDAGNRTVDTTASRHYTLIVSTASEAGSIEELGQTGDRMTAWVNGRELEISPSLQQEIAKGNERELAVGTTGVFYLDFTGRIAGYSSDMQGVWKYGFLLQSQIARGIAGNIQLRLMDSAGSISVVDVADTYKLDGVRYREFAQEQVDVLQYQLIGYKTNQDGQVTEIDTAAVGPDEDRENTLTIGAELGTYKYNRTASVFARDGQVGNFSVDAKAKIFSVPTALGPGEEYYSVYKVAHFGDGDSYYVQAYNLGHNNSTALLVEYGAEKHPGISYDTSPFMLDRMAEMADEDGNPVYKIYGSSQGREITKICDASALDIIDSSTGGENRPLSKGDIIRTTENNKGKTVTIDRLLSAGAVLADAVPYGTVKEEGGDSGYRRQFLTYYGRVYNRDGGLVTLCFEEPGRNSDGSIAKPPLTNVNYSKDFKVTCYDSQRNRVETVSIGDLESYRVTRDFAQSSRVFSYLKYASAMDLFFIR